MASIPELTARLKPRRRITGMSAILLPFTPGGEIDWEGFARHVARTVEAGLVPAVNMDTGYVQLLDDETREQVLALTKSHATGRFVAGAEVRDAPGDPWNPAAMLRRVEQIESHGGMPVIFPCHGLEAVSEEEWIEAHAEIARHCDRFLAFELGKMFVPQGRIVSLEAYRELLGIPRCAGAKHSSLSRELEWERLALRDAERPDFLVLTGNDLAIDMVMWGSDYLLGLSTFAPDLFAARDAFWEAGDARFFELNDQLQLLGGFAFREPVPAYKHDAAMFLHLRGWTPSDRTHPESPSRPKSDREVLRAFAERLGVLPG